MPANRLFLAAMAGLATLLAAIAATYFACAGTLRIWQGWSYVGVFGACAAAITGYLMRKDRALLRRRLQGGPAAEVRPVQKLVQSLASACFLALFAAAGLQVRGGGVVLSPAASVLGDLLVAAGFGVVFFAFRANSYTSAVVDVERGQTVARTGPYAYVRHPMYSGGILLLAATPAALGSSWGWIPVVPLLGVIVFRLLDEERLLRSELPGYEAYCADVRYRLVPWIW